MSNGSKERKYPVMAAVVIAALAFAIMGTAAVYIKRTSNINVRISDSSNVEGVPTAGFYVGGNSHLPGAGNPNATTYGTDNGLVVRYSNRVYTSSGPPDINLYSRATINVNLTNGEWVLDKVIAIGIPGDSCSGQSVDIRLVVEERSFADEAKAKLYYRSSGGDTYHYFGELDLTQTGYVEAFGTTVSDAGFAIYITLDLTYSYPGADDFSIGVYITNS